MYHVKNHRIAKNGIWAIEIVTTIVADYYRHISTNKCRCQVCNNCTNLSQTFRNVICSEANVQDSFVVAIRNILGWDVQEEDISRVSVCIESISGVNMEEEGALEERT